jgi:hypothetical protein
VAATAPLQPRIKAVAAVAPRAASTGKLTLPSPYETNLIIKLRVSLPPWPKLDVQYEGYYMLREKVISYIRGYCEGHTTNVIADFTTA